MNLICVLTDTAASLNWVDEIINNSIISREMMMF